MEKQIYRVYAIVESNRHGKACNGRKVTSSIQVRDYKGYENGYLLLKEIRFNVGDVASKERAYDKAYSWIDEKVLKCPACDKHVEIKRLNKQFWIIKCFNGECPELPEVTAHTKEFAMELFAGVEK
jgi:hypothetical protein